MSGAATTGLSAWSSQEEPSLPIPAPPPPARTRWGSSNDQAKGKEGTAGNCSLLWG